MSAQQLSGVIETDANLLKFDQQEGDIGNWRPMLDGVVLPATAVEDGVPEGTTIPVLLDDRDGPEAEYDSFSESRYIIGIDIPSHQAAVEEVLMAGLGQKLAQSAANTQNTVGALSATTISTTYTDEELYLLKVEGSGPFDFELDRVAWAHVDPDNFFIYSYRPASFVFTNVDVDSTAAVTLSNRHKGTITVTDHNMIAAQILSFDRNTRYTAAINSGNTILPVQYIDPTLEDGDSCAIFAVSYKFAQLDNSADYHLDQRVANTKRQQLTLYRPLGNSTESRVWKRRIYPDVRLTGPASESTGTGQNSLNVRRYNFRAQRIRMPQGRSDYYIEQKVTYPA